MAYGVMASQAMPSGSVGSGESRVREIGAIISAAQNRAEQAFAIATRLQRVLDVLRPAPPQLAPPQPAEGGSDRLPSTGTLVELMDRIESHQDRSLYCLSEIEGLLG